ncbi:hypothetical protein HV170_20975 [Citrobacter freundii]|uniref:hypothetical protein n=1 Tax=Citrobacter freundii TaxID=546 RepID=UPI0015F3D362|nr:hypothetical protein [Citrobacter freundii]
MTSVTLPATKNALSITSSVSDRPGITSVVATSSAKTMSGNPLAGLASDVCSI